MIGPAQSARLRLELIVENFAPAVDGIEFREESPTSRGGMRIVMTRIEPCTSIHRDEWARLRATLWPEGSVAHHCEELEDTLARMADDDGDLVAFAAIATVDEVETMVGFAEAALRRDYVNGCETSPVAFLEGIFVSPDHRRRGVARALCRAVEDWGRARGCQEFASDADIANVASQDMHRALGFDETERVVYFRKLLAR